MHFVKLHIKLMLLCLVSLGLAQNSVLAQDYYRPNSSLKLVCYLDPSTPGSSNILVANMKSGGAAKSLGSLPRLLRIYRKRAARAENDNNSAKEKALRKKISALKKCRRDLKNTSDADEGTVYPMSSASRISGVAPLAVFFDAVSSASGIVAPTLVNGRREYADLHYVWNFGDDVTQTWPTDAKSKNSAIGYVAAHVYETPGIYQVELRVTEAGGTVRTYMQQIVVSDAELAYALDKTRCVSSSGDFDGCPFGAEQVISNNFDTQRTWLFSQSGPRRLLLKRGETFASASGRTISNRTGPYMISGFGNGADPIVTGGAVGSSIVSLDSTATDVRIVALDLVGSDPDSTGIVPGSDTLVLKTRIANFGNAISTSSAYGLKARNIFAENIIELNDQYGIYYNFGEHVGIIGNIIDKPLGSNEHNVRSYITHSLIAHNIFIGGSSAKHQLKFVGYFPSGSPLRPAETSTEAVEYSIISDNRFESPHPDMDWVIGLGPKDADSDQRISDCIFERNFVSAGTNTGAQLMLWGRYLTLRNNIFDASEAVGNTSSVWIKRRGIEPDPLGNRVYNNTFYRRNSPELRAVLIDDMCVNTTVINNLASSPLGQIISGAGSGLVQEHNLFTLVPRFRSADTGDFTLESSSPAIDAGAELESVLNDFNEQDRPFDGDQSGQSQTDLGAFEYRP